MSIKTNLGEKYTPMYFLAALGNGGLVVTFYMFLHFMVPHKGFPMASFDAIKPVFTSANYLVSAAITLAGVGIVFFAFRHFRLLIWNIREYNKYKSTAAFKELQNSNGAVTITAVPLTLAMSINVAFILGAVFVPGLWNIVEYLFPFALAAFVVVGVYALRLYLPFLAKNLSTGNFDCAHNNSLSQMIAIFALTMVGVGMAAPAAMSHTHLTAMLALTVSIAFVALSLLLGLLNLIMGFRAMLMHGVDKQNSASLWVIIPILTLLGITAVRLSHGMQHSLEVVTAPGQLFIVLISIFSIQLFFGILGWLIMKQVGYFEKYLNGDGRAPSSYSLICPGVALFVFGMFVLHHGFVQTEMVGKFSIPYFMLLAGLVYVQVKTIIVTFKLDRKLLRP